MTDDYSARPGWDGEGTYYECPMPKCQQLIKAAWQPGYHQPSLPDFNSIKIVPREGEHYMAAMVRVLSERVHQIDEGNLLAHVQLDHTTKECFEAFAKARIGLMQIHDWVNETDPKDIATGLAIRIDSAVHHGVGD